MRQRLVYFFPAMRFRGFAASGDWVGELQWMALLYIHSSRKCAAPRLRAEAEQRVASFTAELAQQDPGTPPAQETSDAHCKA
jgi:hypothetical protein